MNWTTLLTPLLGLAGCLQVDTVPVVDAGDDGVDQGGVGQDMGAVDPSASWPPVVYDGQREIREIYACESALVWTFLATRDSLGNPRNDEEVWAWAVGGSPQVLAGNLRPSHHRLTGCHEGAAYWSEIDGDTAVLRRRSTSADTPSEFVRMAGRWSTWSMGDGGRVTRWLEDDAGVEVFDVADSSVIVLPFDGLNPVQGARGTYATRDHVYVNGNGGGRIALAPGALWTPLPDLTFDQVFVPVAGRLLTVESGPPPRIQEILDDDAPLTVARSRSIDLDTLGAWDFSVPPVSGRGRWLLWYFATYPCTDCAELGRSAVDEHGNVHVQPLPELSRVAREMASGASTLPIRVVQFGSQIAFIDARYGTIRLADEPSFPCVGPTVPCPAGAVCATTLCAELPN